MYGGRPLLNSLAVLGLVPRWFQVSLPYLDTALMYLILVVALLVWLELSLGKLRFFLQVVMFAGLAIGLAGIVFFLFTGARYKMIPYNNLLAVCTLFVLVTVVAVPRLARTFLVTPDSGVLLVRRFGTLTTNRPDYPVFGTVFPHPLTFHYRFPIFAFIRRACILAVLV